MNLTLDELEERILSVPDALEETLSTQISVSGDLAAAEHWDVCGMGASQGPALLLDSVLAALGIPSRTITNSALASSNEDPRRRQRGLIVFSQGLSPNAQIALRAASSYGQSVLVTTCPTSKIRSAYTGTVLGHPPTQEGGSLVRLVGPPCASLLALRFACSLHQARTGEVPAWQKNLREIPAAVRRILQSDAPTLRAPVKACLTIGSDESLGAPLMWKWNEGLYTPLLPSLDVLAFAHGPLQSLYDQPAEFLCLARSDNALHKLLWQRLEQVLRPSLHQAHYLTAHLPGPLAYFEFDAALSQLVLSLAREKELDPGRWPGQGVDGPLYAWTGVF
jgi:creatinine amidohydrolase